MSERTRTAACAIGVVLIALVLLVPYTTGTGSPMDEGAVNAYASRVLDGAVPHRDFQTFYGPGNLWLVAGAFAVFGEEVATERAVGLLYLITIVSSLFVLAARSVGLVGGVLAGIVPALLTKVEVVWAYATYGAIAFGVLGLALLLYAQGHITARGKALLCFGAGLASGMAVLMRFDFAPAVALSALPLLTVVSSRGRLTYALGLLAGLSILAAHLLIVGPARVERVVSELYATRAGRSLPIPVLESATGRLLVAGALAILLLVGVGGLALWRWPTEVAGRVFLAAGLFGAGLVPYALSRADAAHVRPLALVPLSLLPGAALFLVSRAHLGSAARTASTVVIAAISVGLLLDNPRTVAGYARDLRGIRDPYHGFYKGDEDPARAVVLRAARLAKSGDSLFVGPQDLRRTNYGATYMYFLLPQLRPASYYMEMNPLTANRQGSGLADDLRGSDWLILTTGLDRTEPNASAELGPAEPNRVVRNLFCERFRSGDYRLYERCDRGG